MIDVADFMAKQIIFAQLEDDEKISFLNDNIIIKDKEGKIKLQSTCYRLFALFLVGDASLTTGIIQRAKKFNFSILLFTRSFRLYETIGSKRDSNTILHKLQYNYNSLNIAKHIIKNKIKNQISVLKKNRNFGIDKSDLIKMQDCIDGLNYANNLHEIMGREGTATKIYFKRHFDNVNWKIRVPRIKPDYINSLLDIGYTVLFAYIESILNLYGFDTYCGVLHTMFYMRKSLVCDIIEPFRPIIDQQIKKSINLNQFRGEDFILENDKYQLKWANSQKYLAIFLKSILEYRKEIFVYIQSYYRAFMRQKNISEYPCFLL